MNFFLNDQNNINIESSSYFKLSNGNIIINGNSEKPSSIMFQGFKFFRNFYFSTNFQHNDKNPLIIDFKYIYQRTKKIQIENILQIYSNTLPFIPDSSYFFTYSTKILTNIVDIYSKYQNESNDIYLELLFKKFINIGSFFNISLFNKEKKYGFNTNFLIKKLNLNFIYEISQKKFKFESIYLINKKSSIGYQFKMDYYEKKKIENCLVFNKTFFKEFKIKTIISSNQSIFLEFSLNSKDSLSFNLYSNLLIKNPIKPNFGASIFLTKK